ncbi:MAG: GTPase ObgE [Candidatus Brocadiae bacterium]|nr:GTPase ObgE [Candidatus Brocadiia bacterium]
MFIDEATVHVRAGSGGNGSSSFRREKFVPHGGPDGGDGGKGGDVVFIADPAVDTLLDLRYHRHIVAKSGRPGQGKGMTGAGGEDAEVRIAVGTIIYDDDTGLILRDLDQPGQTVRIALGGHGGRGNRRFASATNRAPRECEEGQPGQERNLRLELKLLADVGLVGLPNAGKSTFLRRISAARPKVANYPFTTRFPSLGIADVGGYRTLVVADIPGLIEGAHEGHGLGIEFLRHIERTRVLLHVLDAAAVDCTSPLDAYHTLRDEIAGYSPALLERPHIVAANKIDLPDAQDALDELRAAIDVPVYPISAATGQGVTALLQALTQALDRLAE